ncbi:MAG: ATP-binding protein [Acidimicrobiaceae bacterium]|nr:ATP-binding protein [Acidimicrobiaceae bacterium]
MSPPALENVPCHISELLQEHPADRPATIGQALAQRDRQLFVGREGEIAAFSSWLAESANGPKILSVTGPGGVGKSTLLRAFVRELATSGRSSMFVDGRVVDPSPEGLAAALGARSKDEATDMLAATRSVLILDAFEDLRPLTHFLLQEFFPSLASDVPVVIASRGDVTAPWRPWRELVRVLPVGGLAMVDAKSLLTRRGLSEPKEIEHIVSVAKGHPLSLSVAADIVLRGGVMRLLPNVPEWHMAVRALVEDLLRDVNDPVLRMLLEGAAILRQFDESTLASISPGKDISEAFTHLCALSIVRPGPHGLMLHDDVRGVIRDDLRWRKPEYFQKLRRLALEHYRRLGRGSVSREEAAWILTEATYLSEDPLIHLGIFSADDPSELWTEPAGPADHERLIAIQASFVKELPERRERPTPEELDSGLMQRLFNLPEARIQMAWHRSGEATGYGLALPILPAVLDQLPNEGAIARIARRALESGSAEELRRDCISTDAWFLGTVVTKSELAEATTSALSREIIRLFAEPRMFLACTADPVYSSVLGAIGFQRLEFVPPAGAIPGLTGFVLDLRLIGAEIFLERLATGSPLPRVPPLSTLETELGAALDHWGDSRWLATSSLCELACLLLRVPDENKAEAVHRLVAEALRRAREAAPGDEQVFRAVELGYLEGSPKLEIAARRMAVSRPTFYRMRKKAMRAMVEQLVALIRAGRIGDMPA